MPDGSGRGRGMTLLAAAVPAARRRGVGGGLRRAAAAGRSSRRCLPHRSAWSRRPRPMRRPLSPSALGGTIRERRSRVRGSRVEWHLDRRRGSMGTPRVGHTAVRLLDGRVLVVGGRNDATVRPDLRRALRPGQRDVVSHREHAQALLLAVLRQRRFPATLLRDGKVLVWEADDPAAETIGAEVYDPGSGTWTATGPMVKAADFFGGTATLLPRRQGACRRWQRRRYRWYPVVRPGHRDLVRDREDDHPASVPHGHAAARRQGARGGRRLQGTQGVLGGAVRSRHGVMDGHREHASRRSLSEKLPANWQHGHVAAGWHPALRSPSARPRVRRDLRSGHRNMDPHRVHRSAGRPLLHAHAVAGWHGADGWRRCWTRRHRDRRAVRTGHGVLDRDREHALWPHLRPRCSSMARSS